jgi:predicted AlkP superfamily pyrophosphatase or phosphodiesterase
MSSRWSGPIATVIVFLLGATPAPAAARKPTLIVQVTMDQLRGELMRRYTPVLSRGFRRIEEGGYWIREGDVAFGLTLSFPGHATLATGMFPYHHGLTGNEWWVEREGKWGEVDVSDDDHYQTVGDGTGHVGSSPQYLKASTLGEWVMQNAPGAKSIALGTGTRIPIAYAGHNASAAIWFDSRLNQFTSSTFYAHSLPAWVVDFNHDNLPRFEKRTWDSTVPKSATKLASTEPTLFHGKRTPSFPHGYGRESGDVAHPVSYPRWFSATPLKDEALFTLAERAVDKEQLGARGVTDYLAIDVDSTDNVGHAYGPRSLEQLDTLVRLDRALEHFLQHLDQTIGRDSYVLALSADHGVADAPDTANIVTMPQVESLLDQVDSAVEAHAGASSHELIDVIQKVLKSSPFVADAYSKDDLTTNAHDPFARLYARVSRQDFTTDFPLWTDRPRNHHPARYGVIVRFRRDMVLDAAVGVHGSPYDYDRDVPILFYGAGIRHGVRKKGGRTVDVAPTLAAAGKIKAPALLDGHPLAFAMHQSGIRVAPNQQ